jgi:hypothetical protein
VSSASSNGNGGNSATGSKSLSGGAIAGIAIGTGLGVLGFCVLAFLIYRHRKSNPAPVPHRDYTVPQAPPPEYGATVQAKVLPGYVNGKGELGGQEIKNTPATGAGTTGLVPYPDISPQFGRQPAVAGISPTQSVQQPSEAAMLYTQTNWVPGQPYQQGTVPGGPPAAEMGANHSLNQGTIEMAGSQDGYRYEMDNSTRVTQPGYVELPSTHPQ